MPVVEISQLKHIYHQGTPYEKKALDDVSISVEKGEFLCLVGANGSGKSTLVQHLNGLLWPENGNGKVTVLGGDTSDRGHRRNLWKKVGVSFQFPEKQLFEATVCDEVAYGLKNMGLPLDEIPSRVSESLAYVGLDPERYGPVPPLCLSGGMMRRVAVANVLAMRPEILVLDEPTAGLDAEGAELVMRAIMNFRDENDATVIIVSHCITDPLLLCDRLAVMDEGRITACGPVKEVLNPASLESMEKLLPDYLLMLSDLKGMGWDLRQTPVAVEDVAEMISAFLKGEPA